MDTFKSDINTRLSKFTPFFDAVKHDICNGAMESIDPDLKRIVLNAVPAGIDETGHVITPSSHDARYGIAVLMTNRFDKIVNLRRVFEQQQLLQNASLLPEQVEAEDFTLNLKSCYGKTTSVAVELNTEARPAQSVIPLVITIGWSAKPRGHTPVHLLGHEGRHWQKAADIHENKSTYSGIPLEITQKISGEQDALSYNYSVARNIGELGNLPRPQTMAEKAQERSGIAGIRQVDSLVRKQASSLFARRGYMAEVIKQVMCDGDRQVTPGTIAVYTALDII